MMGCNEHQAFLLSYPHMKFGDCPYVRKRMSKISQIRKFQEDYASTNPTNISDSVWIFCSNKAIAACIVLNHYQFNGTHRVTHCLVIIWNIPSPRSFWTNSFLTYMYVKKEKPFVYRPFSQIMACKQHSHNAIVHLNFQKYSVKILYSIMDWVCLGQPKQSIVGYSSTCPFMAMTWPRKWILYKYC